MSLTPTRQWSLKRTVQCAKCPWKKATNPHEIPDGYSRQKHCGLVSTIAGPDGGISNLAGKVDRVMACHETEDAHCLGWLMNQVGPGNNIPLRLRLMSCENVGDVKLVGPQHATFSETIPACGRRRPAKAKKQRRNPHQLELETT